MERISDIPPHNFRPARHTLPWADEHPRAPMSASLRNEIRRRVESGMYNSEGMALILARLLIERGAVSGAG